MKNPSLPTAANAGWLYNYAFYRNLKEDARLKKWTLFPVPDKMVQQWKKNHLAEKKQEAERKGWKKFNPENNQLRDSDIVKKIEQHQLDKLEEFLTHFPKTHPNFDGLHEQLGNRSFDLTTTYPGLLLGSGYPHETGAFGELILGFSFDPTTGLPVVPGSSVKGVLRSAFDEQAFPDYVAELLRSKEILGELPAGFSLRTLEYELFGPEPEAERPDSLPLGEQDIFYDAFPMMEESFTTDLFGTDTITPHTAGEFADPTPLPFLKVLPGVTYRFDFHLRPSSKLKKLTPDKKQILFKTILSDLGVGAKTNVGYGNLLPVEEYTSHYGASKRDRNKATRKPKALRFSPRPGATAKPVSKPAPVNVPRKPTLKPSAGNPVPLAEQPPVGTEIEVWGKITKYNNKRKKQYKVQFVPLVAAGVLLNRHRHYQFENYAVGDHLHIRVKTEVGNPLDHIKIELIEILK